ncbi:YggT family protein [Clostridium sp. JNZ J1-5]
MLLLQNAVNLLFQFLEVLILVDIVLSWVYRGENAITRLIHIFTGPFLEPGRRIQDSLMPNLPLDFSPIIGLFILSMLRRIIFILLGFL